jgi:hypothetical protein
MLLMRATSITRGIGRGWALTIETFLGPEMATSEARIIWVQKSREFINLEINRDMKSE